MSSLHAFKKGLMPVCFTLFFLVLVCAAEMNALEAAVPFAAGERLTYQLRWSFLPAGEAVLQVKSIQDIDGIAAYHFVLTAESNSVVDVFYKVRDRIDAYADINMNRSVLYKKKQQEGMTKRDVEVNFDWEKRIASYFNHNKMEKRTSLLPGAFDPLSVFYYSRLLDLKEDSTIFSPVTDGKKCIIGKARIVKREKITLASGVHDAFLLEPELTHIGGVFEKSEDAKIQLWVSADRRRIPLKIKSKVAVGSFVGELVSAEGVIDP